MAIDPKLVSIKTAGELPSGIPTPEGEFLYYEDNTLKKAEMSDLYNRVESAYLGIITPSSTLPATGSWYGTVLEEGTFSNVSPSITVTTEDFDVENGTANNEVRIIISEGVATKNVRRVKGDIGTTPTVELNINDDLDPLLYSNSGALGTAYPYIFARFKPSNDVTVQKVYFDISGNNAGFTKLSIYKSVNGSSFSTTDLVTTQTIAPSLSSIGNNYYEVEINTTNLDSDYTYVFAFSGTGTFQPRTVAKSGFAGSLDGTFDMGRGNTEITPLYVTTHVFKPLIFDRLIVAENMTEVNDTLRSFDIKITALSAIAGKKYAALGDSITFGYAPDNYTPPTNPLKSYAFLAAERLGLQFTNYGITGSRLANLDGLGVANPMSERYTAMIDDADIISVMGGTNDFRNGVPLGTINDTNNQTYYGALKVTAEGLINKYWTDKGVAGAEKLIFFIIPPKHNGLKSIVDNQIPWRQAVIDVCRLYSLPYLDFYYESTITSDQMRTLPVGGSSYNPFITDAVHPTQEGHIRMAKVLKKFIAGYF